MPAASHPEWYLGGEPVDSGVVFCVLGPTAVVTNRGLVAPGGRRQRAVLAALIMAAGQPRSAAALVDDLWDGQPTAAALTTFKVYVSHLRRALAETTVGAAVLVTGPAGYALKVANHQVDSELFVELVAGGRRLLGSDPQGAADILDRALALWRGPAYEDVSDLLFAQPELTRLVETRISAREARAEADLLRGQLPEAVARWQALVTEYPLREEPRAALMRALHLGGRSAEAIRLYHEGRRQLVELGLEPTAVLGTVLRQILDDDRPPVGQRRASLAVPDTTFVGRQEELDELCGLLGRHRLVTVAGPGGVGKTRLALEVANRLGPGCAAGPFLADLSSVGSVDVESAVAAGFGVHRDDRRPVAELVSAALHGQTSLLVLDNAEHVIEAAAAMTASLLEACPLLRILATSREPLRVSGEAVWRIPALETPPEGPTLTASALVSYDSVKLLIDRALAAEPVMVIDDITAGSLAEIARRLDGLPLALELASASFRVMTPVEVASRLDDRLRLLELGPRLGPPRQRTLRSAVSWSHDLLGEDERVAFRRLSVFSGPFELSAAEEVAGFPPLSVDQIVPLVGALVDKSLVVRVASHEARASRYRLLETLREFGRSRLVEAGESQLAQDRHAGWIRSRAELAASHLHGPDAPTWLAILDLEHDEVRSALGHLLDEPGQDTTEEVYRLVAAVWRYWDQRYLVVEGRRWIDRVLRLPGPSAVRLSVLAGAAYLAWMADDLDAADARCAEGLGLARRQRAPGGGAAALLAIQSEVMRHRGRDPARAAELAQAARLGFLDADDEWGAADAERVLALLAVDAGDRSRAAELGRSCLDRWQRVGDLERSSGAKAMLAGLARDDGLPDRAIALYTEALDGFRAVGEPWGTAQVVRNLGTVHLVAGDVEAAVREGHEALALNRTLGNQRGVAGALKLIADATLAQGRLREADRAAQEAVGLFRHRGFPVDLGPALATAARVARLLGEEGRADALLAEAAGLALGSGEPRVIDLRSFEEVKGPG